MIVTSNNITHECNVLNLSITGQVEDFFDVVHKVKIFVKSTLNFNYETEVHNYEDVQNQIGIITSIVTNNETILQTKEIEVDLNTSSISSFTEWKDLKEDQILGWCFNNNQNLLSSIDDEILEKKDRIINPRKYWTETPVFNPWEINTP